jgi:uncharacterized protein YecT (DUF1311 family)
MKKQEFAKTKIVFILKILIFLIIPLMSISQDCEKVKITDFPVNDLPNQTDRAHLKPGEAYKYYYGIGIQIDYVKARQMAFVDIEKNGEEDYIGGYAILMMLYANGFGVERNLDLSIRLAYANVWGAPAEVESRIQHLTNMKTGLSKGTFDICDDITSGLMVGVCHGIRSELADVKRKQRMGYVIKKWTIQEKKAYQKLRNAANTFFDQSSRYEVDLTGTSRDAEMLDASDYLEDQFLSQIKKVARCSIKKKYSKKDFYEADGQLNGIYTKIKDNTTKIEGSVTKEGVRKTQRSWIQYRDAWAVFGTTKCPDSTEFWWKTMITNERIKQLEVLVDNQY